MAGWVEISKSYIENRDLDKGIKEEVETFELKQFKYLSLFLAYEINEVYYCIYTRIFQNLYETSFRRTINNEKRNLNTKTKTQSD